MAVTSVSQQKNFRPQLIFIYLCDHQKFGTILTEYHEWYLCQISLTNCAVIFLYYNLRNSQLRTGLRLLSNASVSVLLLMLSNDVSPNPGPFSLAQVLPKARGLKISHLNVRSLFPKIDEIRMLLKDQPVDIFTVSETWLNGSISDQELYVPGYSLVRQDRLQKKGGGSAVYVRDSIPFQPRPDLNENKTENCWIEINRPKAKKLLVCTCYRAPNTSLPVFIDNVTAALAKLSDDIELIILGDLNVDYGNKQKANLLLKSKLQNFANLHNLDQLIECPTRVTVNNASLIDLIFVNNSHRVVNKGVIPLPLSDHSLVYCTIKAGVAKVAPRTIEYRSYKHYDKELFLHDLRATDWSPVYRADNVNEAVNTWCTIYSSIADQHAPIKRQRVKGNKAPWMTPELSKLMQERDLFHKKAMKSKSPAHWSTYRKLRFKTNEAVKKAKSSYYQECINNNKGNSAGLWKTLNEITSRDNKSGSVPTCISSDEVLHSKPQPVANVLNNYFTSIGTKLANALKNQCNSLGRYSSPETMSSFVFKFSDIQEHFVRKYLASLKTKKAIGLDKISSRLLKDSADAITTSLTFLFNRSLSSAVFPSIWKMGKVVPIFKSGDRTNASNYRPITILPVLSKIIEKAVHMQLYTFLKENKLLAREQFGFRPNLSTEVALAHLTDNILDNMENGLITGAAFLDLSKAFDTVDHQLLLKKLRSLGLDNNSMDWFKSYLSAREQVVSIGNCLSCPKPISVGVPQGSILGPLLFIIYVNDLPNCLRHCKIILYADDTLIHYSAKTVQDIETYLNIDLQTVSQWLQSNLLTLNCDKSRFVLFGSTRRLKSLNAVSIKINESPLEHANSFKYLGVTLREDLSWNEHIKNIVNKTNQRLGLLRRIKTLLPLNARLILYHSLILPLFDYGDIIWGDKNNTLLMNDLQVQQNKAAKLILDRPKYSSATEALEELEWKHLDHRRHLHRCVFIFRCLHNIIDFNFNFRQNNDIHNHNTRQSKNLHLSAPKTNWAKQKLTYQAALDFNLLSPEIQETASILLFKKKVERIS